MFLFLGVDQTPPRSCFPFDLPENLWAHLVIVLKRTEKG